MEIINSSKRKLDIIILAGQSNAEGTGSGKSKVPFIPREDILMLKNEFLWGAAKHPDGYDYVVIKADKLAHISMATERYNGETFCGCFALEFARLYADKYLEEDRQLLIVNTAVGGTGFFAHHWGEGEVLFKRMMDMVKSALEMNEENRVVAFLWHQGEHEVNNESDLKDSEVNPKEKYEFFKSKTGYLVKAVRENFGQDIPFISGEFCNQWAKDFPIQINAVYNASKDLCNEIGRAGFVKASDLTSNDEENKNGDTIHFSKESLRILGQRYFDAFENIINK